MYLLNGRIALQRGAFRAALSKGIECHILDNGGTIERCQDYVNELPHSIAYTNQLMHQAWEAGAANAHERERVARSFYEKAQSGQALISFIDSQKSGLLPPSFDPNAHNIAVFNSAEDELSAVGAEWDNPIYTNQTDGLMRISNDSDHLASHVTIYLRMHPGLKGLNNEITRTIRKLDRPRFVVIPSESPVSSYALLNACNTIVTFCSTIGIEAVYQGKPSVLAGKSMYRELGGTYNPASHAELLELLQKPLQPKSIEAALVYGFYYETFGALTQYFKAESLHTGTFKGRRLSYGRWRDYAWGIFDRIPGAAKVLNGWHAKKSARAILGTVDSEK